MIETALNKIREYLNLMDEELFSSNFFEDDYVNYYNQERELDETDDETLDK